jgi:hypothetical protein
VSQGRAQVVDLVRGDGLGCGHGEVLKQAGVPVSPGRRRTLV